MKYNCFQKTEEIDIQEMCSMFLLRACGFLEASEDFVHFSDVSIRKLLKLKKTD